ncbi:MAG: hypothetical protein GY909_02695 [Oligoflexia bacterium]|nr:hypothetical protein [Oligoflexia bacterium]
MSDSNQGSKRKHFLTPMMMESEAYTSMEMVESWIQEGGDLSLLPVQPLYLSLKTLPPNQAAQYLPKLNEEQRQMFLDLDLWEKDGIDVNEFQYWLSTYGQCPIDEIRYEFAKSSDFFLYLKSKFHISTFDVEDPQYPDHDNYFLTEDNLLLIEFEEDFPDVDALRQIIKDLYSDLGVEGAYTQLFKLVSDNFLNVLEDEYHLKKGRLADAGFVDYFDALQIENCFPNIAVLNNFIEKKERIVVGVDDFSKRQILHKSALVPFKEKLFDVTEELDKIEDDKRSEFLQFNFVRLVNGAMSSRSSLKDGAVAVSRSGTRVRASLELGLDYLRQFQKLGKLKKSEEESLFDYFDFTEIYKIGHSLVQLEQKGIKKALRDNGIEDEDGFLGSFWGEFLDNLFLEPSQLLDKESGKNKEIITFSQIEEMREQASMFVSSAPYIKQMKKAYDELSSGGMLQDSYYLNYTVDQIDFEAIILSSFANHINGAYKNKEQRKMGLTLSEFKDFAKKVVVDGNVIELSKFKNLVDDFAENFGLKDIEKFEVYIHSILKDQVEGYDFEELEEKDFAHVGGPIIFMSH